MSSPSNAVSRRSSGGVSTPRAFASPSSSNVRPPVDPNLFHSILVHNVTHSDLLLGVVPDDLSSPSLPAAASPAALLSSALIAQPKFHKYASITREILKRFLSQPDKQPVYFPSLHYNQTPPTPLPTPPLTPTAAGAVSTAAAAAGDAGSAGLSSPLPPPPLSTLPYGFSFSPPLPSLSSWDGLRLRSSTSPPSPPSRPEVVAFFFPMLSVLIPKWLQKCETQRLKRDIISSSSSSASSASPSSSASSPSSHRLFLYLVSGGGQPWDRSLDRATNSTKCTAQLCQLFLSLHYPHVRVSLIHSSSDIFHYDGNVQFVNSLLLPRLQQHRRELSSLFYEHYPRHLHTTLSITDGPPARVSAIHASLRSFSPDCLHMWQLKSFWHEFPRITGRGEEDVEYQEFDKLEMAPPLRVTDCSDEAVRELVGRMRDFKAMFEQKRDGQEYNELAAFWMRKSRKPVLSVLMVEGRRRGRRFYRGLNMEVSMPTGSLCSERSAIGSALSDDVALCRKDIKLLAVLALPLEQKERRGPDEEERERKREEGLVQEMKLLETTSPTISAAAAQPDHNGVHSAVSPFSLRRSVEPDDAAMDDGVQLEQPPHAHRHTAAAGVEEDGGKEEETEEEEDEEKEEQKDSISVSKRRKLTTEDVAVHRSDSTASLGSSGGFDTSPSFVSASSLRDYSRKQQQLEHDLLLMKLRREQHSGDDEGRNPLNPCGACNEWLKKIAEVNPDFKIITFTSTDCNTVFIKAVKF